MLWGTRVGRGVVRGLVLFNCFQVYVETRGPCKAQCKKHIIQKITTSVLRSFSFLRTFNFLRTFYFNAFLIIVSYFTFFDNTCIKWYDWGASPPNQK